MTAACQELVEIMARLRAPGGCPWDREQTFDSIKPYTLEETYEVLDAINSKLIRRPHVFGEQSAETVGDVKRIWGQVKAAEKKDKGRRVRLGKPRAGARQSSRRLG